MEDNKPATPIQETLETIKVFSRFPATTLYAVSRQRVGFNIVNPNTLLIMAGIVGVLAYVAVHAPALGGAAGNTKASGVLLTLFAVAIVIAGMVQRTARWKEYCKGDIWHSYSTGISYLEMLPLPTFLLQHRRLYRYVEPALWIIVGFFVSLVAPQFGFWLMFGGVAMRHYEDYIYNKLIEGVVKQFDGEAVGQAQRAMMSYLHGQRSSAAIKMTETAGVLVLNAPDLTAGIERMQRHKAQQSLTGKEAASEPVQAGGRPAPVFYKDKAEEQSVAI